MNRALHMAVVTRMRMDPQTRAYIDKRTAQGRTLREIRRSLKRCIARQIYRQLEAAARHQPAAGPTPPKPAERSVDAATATSAPQPAPAAA